MKVDAICRDSAGNEATVLLDLDYVDPSDLHEVRAYCENELFDQKHRFNILDFNVVNYEDIYIDWIREQEENACPIPDIPEDYCLDQLSQQEIC